MLTHRLYKKIVFSRVCSQTLQEIGFSPVRVHLWCLKEGQSLNVDGQISQENDFSPVCVCLCVFKWKLEKNLVLYTSQGNNF